MSRPPSTNLTAADRRVLGQRIEERFKLLKSSICSEQIDVEYLKEQMLGQQQIHIPSTELAVQHKEMLKQREELIEPHIQAARSSLTVRLSELDNQKKEEMRAILNEFKKEITTLKVRVQNQKREIEARFSAEREELQKGLEKVRTEQLQIHGADITAKMDELKKREIEVSQIEREIDSLCKSRIGMLRRQAGKISQIIDDARNNLLEQLVYTDSRDVARKLIEGIPTVATVISALNEGVDGVTKILALINPEATKAMHAIPRLSGPKEVEVTTVVAEASAIRDIPAQLEQEDSDEELSDESDESADSEIDAEVQNAEIETR
jgi:hypothetical protein